MSLVRLNKQSAYSLKTKLVQCNREWRGGSLRPWYGSNIHQSLFFKTAANSGTLKTLIGLNMRFGLDLTEGISDNAKLLITKPNGFTQNNAQIPDLCEVNNTECSHLSSLPSGTVGLVSRTSHCFLVSPTYDRDLYASYERGKIKL